MAYDLKTIANYFINKANAPEEGVDDLSPMKLLKLVYIANGWSLGLRNSPLFLEEVEAWKYGPVIRPLYHLVKHHGSAPIRNPLPELKGNELSADDRELLDAVWDVYKKSSAIRLSTITHELGTPWYKTWHESRDNIIPTNVIRDHYKAMLEQNTAEA